MENLRRLGTGSAEVAFSLADTAGPAVSGDHPFPRPADRAYGCSRCGPPALAAGRIDAFFWSGGLPTEAITTLRRDTITGIEKLRRTRSTSSWPRSRPRAMCTPPSCAHTSERFS